MARLEESEWEGIRWRAARQEVRQRGGRGWEGGMTVMEGTEVCVLLRSETVFDCNIGRLWSWMGFDCSVFGWMVFDCSVFDWKVFDCLVLCVGVIVWG